MLVLLVVFIGLCWVMWGRFLRYDAERAQAVMALQARDTITDSKLLLRLGVVLALVLVGFVTHTMTDLEPSLVALLGAGAAIAVSRVPHAVYLEEVEWETLLFFAGLFVMVGALVNEGVIGDLADWVTNQVGDNHALAAQGMLIGSAVLSGMIDNIPYVATMSPLVFDLVGPGPGPATPGAVTLVGARPRRRPGRQRDRHRRQRQRGDRRHRQAQRPPDLVLDVHPLRTGRDRGDDRPLHPLHRTALLRAGLIRPALSRQPLPCEVDGFGEHLCHRSRSTAGIATHSRNTLPAGANGSPSPWSTSSVTRSRESLTTRRRSLTS